MTKTLISIPGELLKQVDQKARVNHLNRSEAAREAFRHWLVEPDLVPPMDRPGFANAMKRLETLRSKSKSIKGGLARALRQDRESR